MHLKCLNRHGFKDLQQFDNVINNATHKIVQRDGATVFVQITGDVVRQDIILS